MSKGTRGDNEKPKDLVRKDQRFLQADKIRMLAEQAAKANQPIGSILNSINRINEMSFTSDNIRSVAKQATQLQDFITHLAKEDPLEAAFKTVLSPIQSAHKSKVSEKPIVIKTVEDVGQTIRKRRKGMKLTQQQFADLAGVGRRFVSELENGKQTLEFGRVLKLCRFVGVDLLTQER